MEIKIEVKLKQVLNTQKISEITGVPEDMIFEALHKKDFKELENGEKENLIDVLYRISNHINDLITKEIEKEDE